MEAQEAINCFKMGTGGYEAVEAALNALEKQVQKPLVSDKFYHYKCPRCDKYVGVLDNYCSNCGQRILRR